MTPTATYHKLNRDRRKPEQILLLLLTFFSTALGQCPWPRDVAELNGSCLCAFNLKSELSVQCSAVNFSLLMTVLHQRAGSVPFDLLYVNNSNVNVLNDRTFHGLSISNIQFSSCGIYNISTRAFEGLEDVLQNLNLQDNKLSQVPSEAIARLRTLTQLDLSNNKLTSIPARAFQGPALTTLKLADNILQIDDKAFQGLEGSLKNLNLKGTGLEEVPSSIKELKILAFLDLAQNKIRSLHRGTLATLESLTALNLERNLLQRLEGLAFVGVNDTLSSLSLLNNLITDFPRAALNSLRELRVLDIGFNLMTKIPDNAFTNVNSLTLLALDGNPLPTVPVKAFSHLNNTLRGLSVGGRFLQCNCKISWITDWINNFDLQVTSRERNPQFCGQPPELRDRSFYQLSPVDLNCTRSTPPKAPPHYLGDVVVPPTRRPDPPTTTARRRLPLKKSTTTTTTTTERTTTTTTTPATSPKTTTPQRPDPLNRRSSSRLGTAIKTKDSTETRRSETIRQGSVDRAISGVIPSRVRPHPLPVSPASSVLNRPPLIRRNEITRHSEAFGPAPAQGPFVDEVIVQDAYRKDNSVIIQWDSEVSNILGFRVVYRLFGDKQFKLGPPLASSEREFKIRNVPTQECVVVCVVSLEDINITPENVQYEQCREIRTENSAATHMDTIIIAASAAICGTVIIAVIVFICCNRRRGGRSEKNGIPAVLSPISPPLASLGALGSTHKADWDTMSMYSQRSIPRARMYHLDKGSINNGFIPDDARSHISHMSQKSRARSLADGQSQRSYSALSTTRNLGMGQVPYMTPIGLSRPDLRMSHQSLAASQLGQLGAFTPGLRASLSRAPSQHSERRRPSRPKSRERTSSRLSHAGSTHSLTGYDTDGWTDHDMDIYMARNPTRGGLVQL